MNAQHQPFDESMLGMSALFQQLATTSPLDPEESTAAVGGGQYGELQEALNNRSAMLEVRTYHHNQPVDCHPQGARVPTTGAAY